MMIKKKISYNKETFYVVTYHIWILHSFFSRSDALFIFKVDMSSFESRRFNLRFKKKYDDCLINQPSNWVVVL